MDCSTIIVSYNTFALTAEAVRSALASGEHIAHEVVVVDNASPDRSAERLREAFPPTAFPQVRILASPSNLGFSRANNLGAREAAGRILFFLNPDTLVHDNAIPRLVAHLDAHPEVGALGPRVLNADGSDQVSTARFDTAGKLLRYYFALGNLAPGAGSGSPRAVDIVNGCALALRREAFDRVGGWDERYFMYAEENELCLALHRAGYTNVFFPPAVITHYGGAASAERHAEQQVMALQSSATFLRRHASPALVLLNRGAGILGFGLRAVAFPLLAALRPSHRAEYLRRGHAAAAVWRWFVFRYS